MVKAKWHNPADSQDIFQSAAELFALRYRGESGQLGLIIRFFGLLACSAAQQQGCWAARREDDEIALMNVSQNTNAADEIALILDYCHRHGLKQLAKAIFAVKTHGYTFQEAAKEIGITPVRLSKDLRWLGRKIRGGRGEAAQVADLPMFACAAGGGV